MWPLELIEKGMDSGARRVENSIYLDGREAKGIQGQHGSSIMFEVSGVLSDELKGALVYVLVRPRFVHLLGF